MSDLGDRFFAALIKEASMDRYLQFGKINSVFEFVQSDEETYKKFHGFVKKYGKIPSAEAFEDITGRKLPKAKDPADYYYDKLLRKHVRRALMSAGERVNAAFAEKDELKAFKLMQEAISEISLQQVGPKLYDFRESHDLLWNEYKKKKLPGYGLKLGWDYLDEQTGGVRGGDVVSIIGRPAQGKTFNLLYGALNVWEKQKKPVLFVSMEMKPIIIFERLSAMYQHVPYNWVKHGEFPTFKREGKNKSAQDKFFDAMLRLGDNKFPPFNVVDGDLTANIHEIVALSQQLNPAAVFVDGAYLVGVEGKLQNHEKVGMVCNAFKNQIATNLDIPVVASWQFNRESMKIKKNEKAGLEHIAYSDVIAQTSSIVLGMFQEESIETVKRREIRLMKGRSGESGEFLINWDFSKMDFSQITELEDEEVQIT